MNPEKTIFDGIQSESDIDQFVQNRKAEDLYLDFKQTADSATPKLDEDARKFLAKSLSGFANSAGGVLVLGVNAPQNGQYTKVPISDVSTFEQRVLEQISRATTPPVPGVITKIVQSSQQGSGYVIVSIPQSDAAPHRNHTDKQYYHRSGDSFLQMEHYQIADIFGRRHQPKLDVYGVLERNKKNLQKSWLFFTLYIRNNGRALARFPVISCKAQGLIAADANGLDGNGHFGLSPFPNELSLEHFRGNANDVIHAGLSLPILRYHGEYSTDPRMTGVAQSAEVAGTVSAEGMEPKQFQLLISDERLSEFLITKNIHHQIEIEATML
jgi:hypothetical protein